ncbi:MAG: hypothetical protein HOV79_26200 [Hamadaea sp.]|nr:hypothetical protein [Hamadaea sp.]
MADSAYTLWGGLVAAALLAIAALALLTISGRSDDDRPKPVRPADCPRLLAEAKELEEIAAAAFSKALAAADSAARTAIERENAESFRDEAGRLQDDAARALEAAILHPHDEPAPRGDAPAQREASRAAMAAYRRGAISVEQLHVLWQRIDGWDGTLEEQAHELTRLRAEDAEARRRYDAAALAERNARQADEIAQIAARALTEEAADAAREAQEARIAAQDCLRRSRRTQG